MRNIWIYLFALFLPMAAIAQTAAELSEQISDDRGFITGLLERNLSGAGRTVVIDGFEGALSSRATFREIRIADNEGVWLTLRDGAIQWNRSALLRRRIEIAELSAAEILIPRTPVSEGSATPSVSVDAPVFALPELPVALNIDQIIAQRVELGEPLIGVAAAISVDGKMSLAGGEGEAKLTINRLDAARGEFVLDAGYANDTQILRLNLKLDEDADGLLVNLANIYDKPAIQADISGEGEIRDFSADISLATDGQPRVTGTVMAAEQTGPDGSPGTGFRAQIGGDIAALMAPENRAFFGNRADLSAQGWRAEDGRLQIPELRIATDALGIDGSLYLNAQSAPERAQLNIALGRDANAAVVPVALPFAGDGTTVESGRLNLNYDAAEGQGWTLDGIIGQLDLGETRIGELRLDGQGVVVLDGGALSEITGLLGFGATGIGFDDPAMAQAVGDAIGGSADFSFAPGSTVDIENLELAGTDYDLTGDLLISGLSSGITLALATQAEYADLSRLSGVAGRPLSGAAELQAQGYYIVLNRSFDIDAQITGTDITVDHPQGDRLLSGESSIVLLARRDETGTEISEFSINAQRMTAQAQGMLTKLSSDVQAVISVPSLSDIDPDFNGSLQATANLNGPSGARRLSVSGEADDLRIGITELDGALQGRTNLTILAGETDAGYQLQNFRIANPQLNASGQGSFIGGAIDALAQVQVVDLSAIRREWSGTFSTDATIREQDGTRFLDLTGQGEDLDFGQAQAQGALTGTTNLRAQVEERDGTITLRDLKLTNNQMDVQAAGTWGDGITDLSGDVDIRSLAPFGPGFGGALTARGTLRDTGDGLRVLDLTGTGRNLAVGQPQADAALAGVTQLVVQGSEQNGTFRIDAARIENPQLRATASGSIGGGETDLMAEAEVPTLATFGPGWRGSLSAQGTLREAGDGLRRLDISGLGRNLSFGQAQVDGALAGDTRLSVTGTEQGGVLTIDRAQIDNPRLRANASGTVGGGATDVTAQLNASDLRFLGNGIRGALTSDLRLTEQGNTRRITASGTANGLAVGQEQADAVLRGQTRFDLAASQSPGGISVQRLNVTNPQLTVTADGDPARGINLNARLANLGLLIPEFQGAVTTTGTIREQGNSFALDLNATAPGNTNLRVNGTAARDGSRADLTIAGRADAALANPFLDGRAVTGPLAINLRLAGPPELQSLTGRVALTGGQLADPDLGARLDGINLTADFQGARIMVDGGAALSAGGGLRVSGPVDLNANRLDIAIALNGAVLRDPNLYEATASGNIRVTGPMAAPLIQGRVDVSEAELRIPSTGLGGARAIPNITHIGDQRPPVRATRARANLSATSGPSRPASTGPAPQLDLVINAPNRVFVRGRGVDAELGGRFQVGGTTRNVVPTGSLQLIRGRVDLLGNRFVLTEGLIELQGSFDPVIRLVAETERDGITTRIIIDGPVSEPDIRFESNPELPQEEVLSQMLFGRGLDNISAIQAAQLANSIAVLAGTGGEGIIGNLRDQLGLDDLDLTTSDDGDVQLRAGRYLSENVYTDVSIDESGRSTINLNLDVTKSLRARGTVGSDGASSLGLFYERDY
ncbi:translocation/assembly module TamB domain-containing protein [Paracoccus sp. (in: a-proteobacteria)]|uniref:translocation/assembly module TamB domain-containing protein n=1 Tax=Paracoccus sp. TaxID=267 RepID=UPI0026DEF4F4|nr:translocation/assembly module TamB domain-containing protein [Paracoccus sp. (in: a-proteobacteria)]MDO5647022.1 translocation/assembly module TamB domain-containing protein [Paracoccus sp. (in: a-proteobacteria)]